MFVLVCIYLYLEKLTTVFTRLAALYFYLALSDRRRMYARGIAGAAKGIMDHDTVAMEYWHTRCHEEVGWEELLMLDFNMECARVCVCGGVCVSVCWCMCIYVH